MNVCIVMDMVFSLSYSKSEITCFLDHNFKYLMETLDYDREQFAGPPRATDANDVDTFFSKFANIEIIHREPGTIRAVADLKVDIVYYFLTPKN